MNRLVKKAVEKVGYAVGYAVGYVVGFANRFGDNFSKGFAVESKKLKKEPSDSPASEGLEIEVEEDTMKEMG